MVKYESGQSEGVPFTIQVAILPPEYNVILQRRYIKMYVLVKRNEQVVHYATPYTPFRTERPIQT